jgi:hypothetical protein
MLSFDHVIFVNKNWSLNPRIGCSKPKDFTTICEEEFELINEIDVGFKDDLEHKEFMDLCDPPFVVV